MADAGPFNIGDILPFVNPCGYINHTVPFIFPRRNILNNSLIADFDSSFNGEPPFTDRKLDYVDAANDRGLQCCRKSTLFLPGEPLVFRTKGLNCRSKTKIRVRVDVNEFALGSLFREVAHTWTHVDLQYSWDKNEKPILNLFEIPGFTQLDPGGSDGFGTLDDGGGCVLRVSDDQQWIYLNTKWIGPKSNKSFFGGSQVRCDSFADDSYEVDLGPTLDPRIINTDFGNPFYVYIGSAHSMVTTMTSTESDMVFQPIPGLGNIGDNFNPLPWKDFYHAKTYTPSVSPIVTWTIYTQVWALGPADDDPEA